MTVKSESDLRDLLKIPESIQCCVSCHDEFDRMSSPEEIEIDGVVYHCCCRIHEHAAKLIADARFAQRVS